MATLSGHSDHHHNTGEHHQINEPTSPEHAHAPVVLPDTQRPGYWLFGDHATFVATGENTSGQFALFDFFTVPQGGPLVHTHSRESEFAYILEGEMSYQLHDQVITAPAGTFVYKDKNHPHGFANLGTTPTRHLEFAFPSGLESLFATAGLPGAATSPPPPQLPNPALLDQNNALLNQYGIEAPDSLIFAPSEFNLTKEGTPTVTLLRPGNAEAAVSATIAMNDSKNLTQIPVNFASGERIQAVPIPITNESLGAANQTINLALTEPTGDATIGLLQDQAVLTLGDRNRYILTNGNQPDDFLKLIPNQQRPAFWLGGDNYKFVATGADTEGLFSLFDVFVPPQTEPESLLSAPFDKGFYVLDGNVTFQVDDQAFTANPNTFVFLPAGNSYALTNLETTSARTLLFTTSSEIENFFSSMGTPGDMFSSPPISVVEPSVTWGLLAFVIWGAICRQKNNQNSKI